MNLCFREIKNSIEVSGEKGEKLVQDGTELVQDGSECFMLQ